MIEKSKLIEKMFLEKIDEFWIDLKQPRGMIADVPNKSHAGEEYGSVEIYFPGRKHEDVEAYNWETKFMPNPLVWMNDESALYYSQTYLRYFILNYNDNECEETDNIEMSMNYFNLDFQKLKNVTNEQVDIAKRVVTYIKRVFNEGINIDLVCQCCSIKQ